jgi:hypothetical protein
LRALSVNSGGTFDINSISSARSMRTRVPDIGAGLLPHGDGFVVAELAADLLEDGFSDSWWISSTASSGTMS